MSFTAPSTLASRLSLVAGACLALCGAAVQAATPTQADLDSIVLYGSTTIAQDSTSAWGVWEQIEPPAAGPAQPSTNAPSSPEWYRPLAQVSLQAPAVVEPGAVLLCAGGSFCGFGQAQVTVGTELLKSEKGTSESSNLFAYHLIATPANVELPSLERAAAVNTASATTSTTTFTPPYAVTVQSQSLDSSNQVLSADSGVLYNNGYGYRNKTGTENSFQSYSITAKRLNSETAQFYDNATILAAWYEHYIYRYTTGNDNMSKTSQLQLATGVIGVTTSDADMAALRASNATATYTGHDVYGLNNGSPNMKLNVNFGNGTFTGSLNNGVDGVVTLESPPRGTQVAGAVGVNIDKGVITGANFTATALSANDGSIQAGSVVQGAFFGPNAAAAGGVVNIVKTTAKYSNATFVSPFLTVNDKLIKAPAPVMINIPQAARPR